VNFPNVPGTSGSQPSSAGEQGNRQPSVVRFAGFQTGVVAADAVPSIPLSRPLLPLPTQGTPATQAGVRVREGAATVIRLNDLKFCTTQQSYLAHASHFIACHEGGGSEHCCTLNPSLAERGMREFEQPCLSLYTGAGRPLDIVGDDPLTFVLKCQAMDAQRRGSGTGEAGCVYLLRIAMEMRNLPVTCKILQGLTQAKHNGSLDEEALYAEQSGMLQGGLLHHCVFYHASSPWRQLVLSAGVFDPSRFSAQVAGFTPLFRALQFSVDSVADLLAAGADPNKGTTAGCTPLGLCVTPSIIDRMPKLELLLCCPALQCNQTTTEGGGHCSPLHSAVSGGDLDVVARLLMHPGVDTDLAFDVKWHDSVVMAGSALAAAAFCFLACPDYPVQMVEQLAAAGARLLIVNAAGETVDLHHDISQLVQWVRQRFPVSEANEALLRAAVYRGLDRRKGKRRPGLG